MAPTKPKCQQKKRVIIKKSSVTLYDDDWTQESTEEMYDTEQVGKKDATDIVLFVSVDQYQHLDGSAGYPTRIITRNDIMPRRAKAEIWRAAEAAGLSAKPYRSVTEQSEKERLATLTADLRASYPRWSYCAGYALLDCAKTAGVDPPTDLKMAHNGKERQKHYWLCVGPAYDETWQFQNFLFHAHLNFGGKEEWEEKVEKLMWKCYADSFTKLKIEATHTGSPGFPSCLGVHPDALTKDAKKELYFAFQAAGLDGMPCGPTFDLSTEEGRALATEMELKLEELQALMEDNYPEWSSPAARVLLECAKEAESTPPEALVESWDPKDKRKPRYFQTCGPFFNNQEHFNTFIRLIHERYEGGKEAWDDQVEKLMWKCHAVVKGGSNTVKLEQKKRRHEKKMKEQARAFASLSDRGSEEAVSEASDDSSSHSSQKRVAGATDRELAMSLKARESIEDFIESSCQSAYMEATAKDGSTAAPADQNLAEMLKHKSLIVAVFKDDEQEGAKEVSPSPLNRKGGTADDAIELSDDGDSDDSEKDTDIPSKAPLRAANAKRKLPMEGKRKSPSEEAEPAKVKKEYAGRMASTYMKACEDDRRLPDVEFYEMLLKQDKKDMENSK